MRDGIEWVEPPTAQHDDCDAGREEFASRFQRGDATDADAMALAVRETYEHVPFSELGGLPERIAQFCWGWCRDGRDA